MPDREKVIKGLGIVSRMLNEMGRRNEMDIVDDAIVLLKQEAVVRCQDCKWRGREDDSPKWIPCLAIRTNDEWFCADGKRRVDDA